MHPLTSLSWRRLLMSLVCLITLGASLFLASGVANASTSPPILAVSPTIFNGNTDCAYSAGQGWNCTAMLSRGDTLQKNLTWSAHSSGITGITFNPASGVLAPGATASVSISVPDTVCPTRATFNQSSANCPFDGNTYRCTVTLGETASSTGTVNWVATSTYSDSAIVPTSGTLSPGGSTMVILDSLPC
jgi:hypothetical protein